MKIKEKVGDVDMSYIHDSVGAHPNNIALVKVAINEVLLEVFNSNALQKIVDQLLEGIENVPEELKTAPFVGDWLNEEAVEHILNSQYAFS